MENEHSKNNDGDASLVDRAPFGHFVIADKTVSLKSWTMKNSREQIHIGSGVCMLYARKGRELGTTHSRSRGCHYPEYFPLRMLKDKQRVNRTKKGRGQFQGLEKRTQYEKRRLQPGCQLHRTDHKYAQLSMVRGGQSGKASVQPSECM